MEDSKSTPITGHAGPEGSRRVKAPRFLDIVTIWWYGRQYLALNRAVSGTGKMK
jgi:hypothetical protein